MIKYSSITFIAESPIGEMIEYTALFNSDEVDITEVSAHIENFKKASKHMSVNNTDCVPQTDKIAIIRKGFAEKLPLPKNKADTTDATGIAAFKITGCYEVEIPLGPEQKMIEAARLAWEKADFGDLHDVDAKLDHIALAHGTLWYPHSKQNYTKEE